MKKKFPKDELLDLEVPFRGDCVIEDKIVDTGRWSEHHEVIFRLPDQPEGEAWRAHYSRGATEQQDERPWEYDDDVECELVRQVEKLVKVWEPANDA